MSHIEELHRVQVDAPRSVIDAARAVGVKAGIGPIRGLGVCLAAGIRPAAELLRGPKAEPGMHAVLNGDDRHVALIRAVEPDGRIVIDDDVIRVAKPGEITEVVPDACSSIDLVMQGYAPGYAEQVARDVARALGKPEPVFPPPRRIEVAKDGHQWVIYADGEIAATVDASENVVPFADGCDERGVEREPRPLSAEEKVLALKMIFE